MVVSEIGNPVFLVEVDIFRVESVLYEIYHVLLNVVARVLMMLVALGQGTEHLDILDFSVLQKIHNDHFGVVDEHERHNSAAPQQRQPPDQVPKP